MRKITLVFSFLFILSGILIRVISNFLEELMPKIGFAAFQSAATGSYTPDNYQIDLSANYGWSTFCISVFEKHIYVVRRNRGHHITICSRIGEQVPRSARS